MILGERSVSSQTGITYDWA